MNQSDRQIIRICINQIRMLRNIKANQSHECTLDDGSWWCVWSPSLLRQMGKHDEAWMVLKHIHDTNMRARGEPERVFTVSTRRPPRPARCCSAGSSWQISVSPCRWTGSRSPNSWTSWWSCRASRPTRCWRSSSRSRQSSEEYDSLLSSLGFILTVVRIQTK